VKGSIDRLCQKLKRKVKKFSRLNRAFEKIDNDLSGKLSIEELQKLIKMIDKSVEARVTETMFEKIFSRENPASRGNLENRLKEVSLESVWDFVEDTCQNICQ
jgi:Ca2+-binding EF-hand superfamily protein